MRVLVATDGSDPSVIGSALGRDLATLGHGEIRIVSVLPPVSDLLGGAWPTAASTIDPQPILRAAREQLAAGLRREVDRTPADLHPTSALLAGRPAEEIVSEAIRWGADIIVVGSRGHGALSSILVGSVAEEIVDRSPVPVVVARRPQLRRIVVAVDGSSAAEAAVDVLRWEMFHGLQAWVVDVAPTAYPWWLGLASADGDRHQRLVDASLEARDAAQTGAESACRSLRAAGLTTQSCHRIGDPADELLRAAAELDVDTIVIGSRGQTGVARFVAGSVARHVIRHANASVVIVHPPRATAPATRGSPPAATLVSNH